MGYVELRAHTAFSFGDGGTSPEALVSRAAELGYGAIGITDTADLGGIVRFGLEARRLAVKPIVGAELVVDGHPAAFIARTREGYQNLASLVTRSRVGDLSSWKKGDGKKTRGRPRISWDQVAERSEGLQALTGPASGLLGTSLRSGDYRAAERTLCLWRDAFGERLAVEVQLHHTSGSEAALAAALIELAELNRVPWVICHEPRYVDNASRLVHDVLTALRYDTTIDDALARGLLHPNGEWRLNSPAEMAERWKGREAGLAESERISGECDFSLEWVRPPLPDFPLPGRHTLDSFLREKVFEGAHERWGAELSDGEKRQIEHDRREEVLDYVYDKYNRAKAAITCIVQMYRGPNALRDSMRAFGYPIEMANNLSKRI
ncbi:MAG TPA: PHP domain-containing protein, partial [Gemmatimonadaceae bacterium]|nr:PHP domain-containing protein [Gemmatimonadaceae bacterium]